MEERYKESFPGLESNLRRASQERNKESNLRRAILDLVKRIQWPGCGANKSNAKVIILVGVEAGHTGEPSLAL